MAVQDPKAPKSAKPVAATAASGAAVSASSPKPAVKKPVVAAPAKVAPAQASTVARKPVATPTSAAPVRTASTAPLAKDDIMTDTNQIFSTLNDRTKGAVEKGTQYFEELNAFSKGNIEAIVESSKIVAKNVETLGQDAATRAKAAFEGATEAARTLAAAKSPTEFLKLHSDYARTAFDTLIAETSRSTEQFLKMFGEAAQPISNRVAVATEKLKINA